MKLLVLTPPNPPAPEFSECLKLLRLHWTPDESALLELYSVHGFTHVIYTSSHRSFFTWNARSIHAAYAFVGYPRCLISAHKDFDSPDPRSVQLKTHRLIYRYPHFGAFMGEIPFIYSMLDQLRHGDIQINPRQGVKVDNHCEVFHNMGADGYKDLTWDSREGYFVNEATKSTPCVLNFTEGTKGMPRLFKRWKRAHLKMKVRMARAKPPYRST